MKHIFYFCVTLVLITSCNNSNQPGNQSPKTPVMTHQFASNYSTVNGIKMYYELYGRGEPLVLLHGGGSTIQSSFGRIIPDLAKHYTIIAIELQNHGRSGFRDVPETFEQDADDVAALLDNIGTTKASFLGFSNGGTTALQLAIRHPAMVNKLILVACAYKRSGFINGFFESMPHATLNNMPKGLQEAFMAVNNDSAKLQTMFERDRDRMVAFKDIDDELVRSIKKPTLVINGDHDVVTSEHTLEIVRAIDDAELAIIPGTHGKYIGEVTTLDKETHGIDFMLAITKAFLDKRVPVN
jgi:pimeloyl-ACP methyl ester carboxylesterase